MTKTQITLCVAIIAAVLLATSQAWPSKAVKIYVFDIGQGDAIFIDGKQQMLIDGGPDAAVLERLSSVMPWWDRSINYVVNTHPHADHLTGLLPVLERYHVDHVLDADEGYNTPEFYEYVKLAGDRRDLVSAGDVIDLGQGLTLKVLWPESTYNQAVLEDPNDGSVVMLLTYGDTSMLLTGDAGIAEENSWDVGDIDILKVGHHGSDTSTSQELLDRIKPEVGIISVGQPNDYGHPSSFVVDRLIRAGVKVFRTDLDGSIKVKTTGGEPRVQPARF